MNQKDSDLETRPYCVTPEDKSGFRLLQNYLARRRSDVALFREALERGDYAVIRRMGHNLRGSGASYDLVRISTLGAEIERAADRCAPGQLERALAELESFVESVVIIEPT